MTKKELTQALTLLRQGNWQAAHVVVQQDEDSPLSCWAHGIVHLMEGDVANARYWYRQARRELPSDPSIAGEIEALGEQLSAWGE